MWIHDVFHTEILLVRPVIPALITLVVRRFIGFDVGIHSLSLRFVMDRLISDPYAHRA